MDRRRRPSARDDDFDRPVPAPEDDAPAADVEDDEAPFRTDAFVDDVEVDTDPDDDVETDAETDADAALVNDAGTDDPDEKTSEDEFVVAADDDAEDGRPRA